MLWLSATLSYFLYASPYCKFYCTIKLTLDFRNFHGKKFPGLGSGFRFLYFQWSYHKNFNAYEFVMTYWFIHKIFRSVRGPVFYPVSGFCNSDGHIWKIPMQVNLYWHTNSSVQISGWSGVRFSVWHTEYKYFWFIARS